MDYIFCILALHIQKEYDNNNNLINQNQLITCGSIPDPRIQFEIDIATTITLAFKSDPQIELKGVNLYILEIQPSSDDSVRLIIITILYCTSLFIHTLHTCVLHLNEISFITMEVNFTHVSSVICPVQAMKFN